MSLGTQRKFNLEQVLNEIAADDNGLQKDIRVKNILNPIDGYHVSDQIVAATSYYGYLNKSGYWYIMKAVDAGGGEINYTYKAGTSGYVWANRAAGVYADFATTFGSY